VAAAPWAIAEPKRTSAANDPLQGASLSGVLLWVLAPHFGTLLVQSNEERRLAISEVAQGPDSPTIAISRRAVRLLLPSFGPVWTAGGELVPTGGIKLEAINDGV